MHVGTPLLISMGQIPKFLGQFGLRNSSHLDAWSHCFTSELRASFRAFYYFNSTLAILKLSPEVTPKTSLDAHKTLPTAQRVYQDQAFGTISLGFPLALRQKTCTAETTVLYKDPLKRRLCCCKTKEVPELFKLVATVWIEHATRALPRTRLLSAEGHPYGGKGRTQLRQGNSNKSLNLVKLS